MARISCAAFFVCAGASGPSVALATFAQDPSLGTRSQQAAPPTHAPKNTRLTTSNHVGGGFDNPTFKQDGFGTRGGCANAQPGDFEENEPFDCPGANEPPHNGGCSDDPPSFSPLSCGLPVHGESGTFVRDGVNYRDTDWWLFDVTDNHAILTWTVTADFPVLIGLIRLPCPATQFIPGTISTAPACTVVTSISPCLPPGQYAAFVAPSVFTGVACGSEYRGTLACTPCAPPPPPPNDNCADAQLITCGESVNGTNVNATTDGFAPCGAAANDVWYKFVAPREWAIVDTCNLFTPMDTVLAVFDGCGGSVLGCNDDMCGLQARVVLTGLTIGNTYYVCLAGFAGGQGTFLLTLSDCGSTGACCLNGECRVLTELECNLAGGLYQGDTTRCEPHPCDLCPGDLDHDGDRDLGDLAILLSQFGASGPDLSGDIDGNGIVELQDLASMLALFSVPC